MQHDHNNNNIEVINVLKYYHGWGCCWSMDTLSEKLYSFQGKAKERTPLQWANCGIMHGNEKWMTDPNWILVWSRINPFSISSPFMRSLVLWITSLVAANTPRRSARMQASDTLVCHSPRCTWFSLLFPEHGAKGWPLAVGPKLCPANIAVQVCLDLADTTFCSRNHRKTARWGKYWTDLLICL